LFLDQLGAHLSFWRLAILPGRTRPVWRGLPRFRPEPALRFSSGLGAEALEMAAPGGVASRRRKSAAYPRLQKTEMRPQEFPENKRIAGF
jgi:hypothetical protein